MLLSFIKKRRERKQLERYALPDALWSETRHALPFLNTWNSDSISRLRRLTTLFLIEKNIFSGHADFTVTPEMRTLIAAQACTLILHRSLDDYAGWTNVIVHPDGFPRTEDFVDEAGVVHTDSEFVAGEAWEDGPVLLSWPDVVDSLNFSATGMNLVIHEFAHKIDMRNGDANGTPPMENDAQARAWHHAIDAAYEDFCRRVDADEETEIDPYASEHISEFFAVCAEVYVAAPAVLSRAYPALYGEMNRFFKLWR